MADDNTSYKLEKTITLNKLKPNEYRLWQIQAESTLEVHKCLDIVLGNEPNPTPMDDDGKPIGPIGRRLGATIASWETRHALAREALLKCLEPADLLKVYLHRYSAPAIWTRLQDEYGRPLDYEYIRINNDFVSLRRGENVPIDEHINRFNQLLQDVEYNRPPTIAELRPPSVNLQFMMSLGDGWDTFMMAKGDWIHRASTAELHAEIRAMDARRPKPITQSASNPSPADAAKALSLLRLDDYRRDGYNNDNWHDARYRKNNARGNGPRGRGRDRGQGQGRDNGVTQDGRISKKGRNKKKSSFDPNKYCTRCQVIGHDIFVCRKHAREQEEKKKGNAGNGNGNSGRKGDKGSSRTEYQPSYVQDPYHYSANTLNLIAKVTRFIANTSEITSTSINSNWIVDSAANAYITPFKTDLRFFIEQKIGQVKGFGGKLETAEGKGSVTLTDVAGNRVTLNDVYYVPDSQDRILSMMKFRREYKADFQFTGPESFTMIALNGFQLQGISVNDILYTTIPQTQANAAITRNAAKRRNIEISDPSDDEHSPTVSDLSELEQPFRKRLRLRSNSPPSEPLTCSPSNLWHLRYGAASTTVLRKLKLIKSTFDSAKCEPCIRAKKTRKPFHRSESKATKPLEQVHSDICGQYPESEGNSIYNLTFLDEFTHYVFTVPIPDKSSETVKKEFSQWIAAVETETGRKVKCLRTDGGGEYQGELTPVLKALGIKHEKTPPRTPQLNGKAERLNRTLNDTVRAMLIHANLPYSFWAEAMATAVYLKNRLPSEAIDDDIPFQRWYRKSLTTEDLKLLKPFGCIVYDYVDKQTRGPRSKWKEHGTKGCFVGYESSSTYKYWNFARKCFLTSHNLTFLETEFPKQSDFGLPASAFPSHHPTQEQESMQLDTSSESETEQTIHEEIVVERPPIGHTFTAYGPLADNKPLTFKEAMSRPDNKLWWQAMIDEIKAVIQNKAWQLADLPPGKKAIPLKWVFKIKRDAKGSFEKYKARIVVRGFAQVAGLDFDETFAPVVRIESIRIILAIAAANDLYILHVDCTNAFLHGKSDVEIYVTQPEGFLDRQFPDKVLRLNKSLYGLKQAPRIWYLFLCGVIVGLGFIPLETDSCIYIRGDIIMEVYVDDIKIVGPNKAKCEAVYQELSQHVKVKSKGPIKSFLGIDVIRNWNQHLIALNQGAYIDYLVAEFGLTDAHIVSTPLEKSLPLLAAIPGEKMCNLKYYQRLVGSLNHLAIFTRPDIAFAASKLAQFNSNPTATHLKAALHVVRYLKGTRNLSIIYKRQEHELTILGHSDSDWASDSTDRKSFTGYCFMVHGGPATWNSHKQATVAHSTTDAEYMAISDASREAIARIQFFQELSIPSTPILILADSETALDIANGTAVNHRKAKHIDIKYHAIRHYIQEEKVVVNHIPSSENIADLFTKALGPQKHQRLVDYMGMRNFHEILE
jgi:transposase InsO family protein